MWRWRGVLRFAGQIISRTVKGGDGPVHVSVRLTHEPCPQRGEKRSCAWKVFRRYLLGHQSGSEEFIVGTPAGCVMCRTVKRRPGEDAADPVFSTASVERPGDLPDDEPRDPREPREQPVRIDVRRMHADLPPSHVACTSEI